MVRKKYKRFDKKICGLILGIGTCMCAGLVQGWNMAWWRGHRNNQWDWDPSSSQNRWKTWHHDRDSSKNVPQWKKWAPQNQVERRDDVNWQMTMYWYLRLSAFFRTIVEQSVWNMWDTKHGCQVTNASGIYFQYVMTLGMFILTVHEQSRIRTPDGALNPRVRSKHKQNVPDQPDFDYLDCWVLHVVREWCKCTFWLIKWWTIKFQNHSFICFCIPWQLVTDAQKNTKKLRWHVLHCANVELAARCTKTMWRL